MFTSAKILSWSRVGAMSTDQDECSGRNGGLWNVTLTCARGLHELLLDRGKERKEKGEREEERQYSGRQKGNM